MKRHNYILEEPISGYQARGGEEKGLTVSIKKYHEGDETHTHTHGEKILCEDENHQRAHKTKLLSNPYGDRLSLGRGSQGTTGLMTRWNHFHAIP